MYTLETWKEGWNDQDVLETKAEAFEAVEARDGHAAVLIMGLGIESLALIDGVDRVADILETVINHMRSGAFRWSDFPKDGLS